MRGTLYEVKNEHKMNINMNLRLVTIEYMLKMLKTIVNIIGTVLYNDY